MSAWPATKARRVYAALLRLGWRLKKQIGSHRKLERPGWKNFTFAFHDSEEVGPAALARIARDTGLKQEDL
jgi:predicted RNA binding protein YcfA (HicA-like mRNA interferase family)